MVDTWLLVVLVMMPGVWSGEWGVTYHDQCTFEKASVLLRCYYDYPDHHSVTLRRWYKYTYRWVYVGPYTAPQGHFEYLGDFNHDCTLRINNVRYSDGGLYLFYFETSHDRWRSQRELQLKVRALTAAVQPGSDVVEGQNVSLTCGSACPTTQHRFVWFREGQRVTNLQFQARREDAGRYHCAIEGQEGVRSAAVPLNVKYAPSDVVLSHSQPSGVVKGTSLTFSCSSNANPPVEDRGYSLYKDQQLIGTGQNHTIAVVLPGHSGRYHCRAWNNISRAGEELFHSTEVDVDVQYLPMNTSAAAERPDVLASSSVNLTCSSEANPPPYNYTWYKKNSSSSLMQWVGSGSVLTLTAVSAADSGIYMCQAWNLLGQSNSTEMLLTVKVELRGIPTLPVLAGVGAFALVTLLIALLMFQKKQQKHDQQKELDDEDPSTVYANISSAASTETPPPREKNCFSYAEQDVIYSSVTIKPRKPPRQITQETQDPESIEEENDSVIYSTVNKRQEV